jgi:hypothetical protein
MKTRTTQKTIVAHAGVSCLFRCRRISVERVAREQGHPP